MNRQGTGGPSNSPRRNVTRTSGRLRSPLTKVSNTRTELQQALLKKGADRGTWDESRQGYRHTVRFPPVKRWFQEASVNGRLLPPQVAIVKHWPAERFVPKNQVLGGVEVTPPRAVAYLHNANGSTIEQEVPSDTFWFTPRPPLGVNINEPGPRKTGTERVVLYRAYDGQRAPGETVAYARPAFVIPSRPEHGRTLPTIPEGKVTPYAPIPNSSSYENDIPPAGEAQKIVTGRVGSNHRPLKVTSNAPLPRRVFTGHLPSHIPLNVRDIRPVRRRAMIVTAEGRDYRGKDGRTRPHAIFTQAHYERPNNKNRPRYDNLPPAYAIPSRNRGHSSPASPEHVYEVPQKVIGGHGSFSSSNHTYESPTSRPSTGSSEHIYESLPGSSNNSSAYVAAVPPPPTLGPERPHLTAWQKKGIPPPTVAGPIFEPAESVNQRHISSRWTQAVKASQDFMTDQQREILLKGPGDIQPGAGPALQLPKRKARPKGGWWNFHL